MSQGRQQVYIDFSSADASTAAELTLFDLDGNAILSLSAQERVVIHSLQITAAATGLVTVFDDADDDNAVDSGERIVTASASTSTVIDRLGCQGRFCAPGIIPHVIAASAGQLNVTGQAEIVIGGDNTGSRPDWREDPNS